MRIKCLFCRYKDVCIPEQEIHLTKYSQLQLDYKELSHNYTDLLDKYYDLKVENLELKTKLHTNE